MGGTDKATATALISACLGMKLTEALVGRALECDYPQCSKRGIFLREVHKQYRKVIDVISEDAAAFQLIESTSVVLLTAYTGRVTGIQSAEWMVFRDRQMARTGRRVLESTSEELKTWHWNRRSTLTSDDVIQSC